MDTSNVDGSIDNKGSAIYVCLITAHCLLCTWSWDKDDSCFSIELLRPSDQSDINFSSGQFCAIDVIENSYFFVNKGQWTRHKNAKAYRPSHTRCCSLNCQFSVCITVHLLSQPHPDLLLNQEVWVTFSSAELSGTGNEQRIWLLPQQRSVYMPQTSICRPDNQYLYCSAFSRVINADVSSRAGLTTTCTEVGAKWLWAPSWNLKFQLGHPTVSWTSWM